MKFFEILGRLTAVVLVALSLGGCMTTEQAQLPDHSTFVAMHSTGGDLQIASAMGVAFRCFPGQRCEQIVQGSGFGPGILPGAVQATISGASQVVAAQNTKPIQIAPVTNMRVQDTTRVGVVAAPTSVGAIY